MTKEIDQEGQITLDVISKADRFNLWMYETIVPFCQGNILEIGSGIGNITQYFVLDNKNITLSDLRENYCALLKEKFPENEVVKIDLVADGFELKYSDYLNTFDSVFALNVIEHIEHDSLAIHNCKKLLKPGGKLVILVPAYQFLYNEFDLSLGHFRRYNKTSLNALVQKSGFSIVKSFYFNCVGIAGWFVSGKIFKNKTIPEGQMGFYNALVPLIKVIDFLVLKKVGLSVVVVSERNENK